MAELIMTQAKYDKMTGAERREYIQRWKAYGWRNKELQIIMPVLQNFTVRTSGHTPAQDVCQVEVSLTIDQLLKLYKSVESEHTAQQICQYVGLTEQELMACGSVYALFYTLSNKHITAAQVRTMLMMGVAGKTAYVMWQTSNTTFYIAQMVQEVIFNGRILKVLSE